MPQVPAHQAEEVACKSLGWLLGGCPEISMRGMQDPIARALEERVLQSQASLRRRALGANNYLGMQEGTDIVPPLFVRRA